MPTSTKCLRILGAAALLASAGCSTTSGSHQTSSLAPSSQPAPSVVASGLPESMEVASADRETVAADASQKGTVISAVAYASSASNSGGLAALQNAVSAEQAQAKLAAVPAAGASAPQGVSAAAMTLAANASVVEKAEPVAAAVPPAGQSMVEAGPVVAQPVVLASLDASKLRTFVAAEPKKPVAARSPELDALIARYAKVYEVPVDLVRRVVKRESTFNPAARNGPYWGLMQIRHDTAKGMGYRGTASGLLDAETNLTYAVKYLRGAFITASGDHDQAVKYYSRGYYYDAKKRGLLEETGLRPSKAAAPVRVASADAAAEKLARMQRRSQPSVPTLPGVASHAATPTSSTTD